MFGYFLHKSTIFRSIMIQYCRIFLLPDALHAGLGQVQGLHHAGGQHPRGAAAQELDGVRDGDEIGHFQLEKNSTDLLEQSLKMNYFIWRLLV